jgi:5-(hydroxymethyl)furfural/furfural oxidase
VLAFLVPGARLRNGARPLQVGLRYSSRLEGAPAHDMYASVFSRASWHGVGARLGMIMTWVNKAYSVGRVSLRSPRMEHEPQVHLNLCGDPRDLARLAAGMRFVASLYRREPLSRVALHPFPAAFSARSRAAMTVSLRNRAVMGLLGQLLDGPAGLRSALISRVITEKHSLDELLADESGLEAFVHSSVVGIKHVSGTCRMGRREDPAAVTDPTGLVHGVEGLRVVDASLMPSLPRANTSIPTVMIAEKISDSIH